MSNDVDLVGTIVLTINGTDYDCASVTPKRGAGRKAVSSMNKTGAVRRQAKVTKNIALSFDIFIPESGDIDFDGIENGTLTIESLDGSWRETYTGVGVTDVSEAFGDGNEAKRSLNGYAFKYIKETVS